MDDSVGKANGNINFRPRNCQARLKNQNAPALSMDKKNTEKPDFHDYILEMATAFGARRALIPLNNDHSSAARRRLERGDSSPLFVRMKLNKSGARPPRSKRFAIFVVTIGSGRIIF